MEKFLLYLITFLFICFASIAQDLIVKTNAEEVNAKVLEIKDSEVRYKKFENQEGPTYVLKLSDVFFIKYQTGEKIILSQIENKQTRSNFKSGYVYFSLGSATNFGPLGTNYYGQLQNERGAGGFYLGGGFNVYQGIGVKAMINSFTFTSLKDKEELYLINSISAIGPQFSVRMGNLLDLNGYLVFGRGFLTAVASNSNAQPDIRDESGFAGILGLNARIPANYIVSIVPSANFSSTTFTRGDFSNISFTIGICFNFGRAGSYFLAE